MKKVNKYTIILLIMIAIKSSALHADHFMGGQLSYETFDIDSLRGIFQITLRLERPCSSNYKFNQEYPIKVLEYSTKPSPKYNLSVYAAKLYDSSYIYYPCAPTSATCSNPGGQVIEVKYYRAQIVIQNTNKECVVYFDEYSNRSYNDNLVDDDPMVLFTSFIPKYSNSQGKLEESKRHFPLKDVLAKVSYIISDYEGDSLSFRTSLPFKSLSYSINGSNLTYNLVKSQAKVGLSDQRPFFMQESSIIISPNTIQFTPSVGQSSWLTTIQSEFRKVTLTSGKDTWICISRANMDRLFSMFQINSQFRLLTISSNSPSVKINNNQITICNNGVANIVQFEFPIETGIQINKLKVNLGTSDISSQFTTNRKISSSGMDTLVLSYNYSHPSTNDLSTDLQFNFELCHASSGVGFDRSFQTGLNVFNYKIFDTDTILSCSSALNIPTLGQKPLNLNWGNYIPANKMISISNPKDTWLTAQLQFPNPNCPSRDSVYINQGSVFNLNTTGYMPSCKGYADASAKVKVSGTNGPFTYRWSNSSIQDSIASISAGKHIVEVSDKDNCKQTDTLVILDPYGIDAHWVMDSTITCYGGANGRGHIQVTSTLKPFQYNWTTVMAIDSFLDQLSAGTYQGSYRYVNLSGKTCDQGFIFDIKGPDSIYLHIVTTDNTCYGGAMGKIAVLPIGGHGDFSFYFNNVSSSVGYKEGLTNGVVSLYVEDSKNCLSSTYSVTISSPDRLKYNIIANNPSCAQVSNGLINIHHASGGVGPYAFAFGQGEYAFNTYFPNLGVGTYTIKMRDANGCILIQDFTLSANYALNAKLDLLEDSKCPLSKSGKIHLELTNGQSPYRVYMASDSMQISSTGLKLNNLAKGTYPIKIVDNNHCSWTTQYRINEPDTIKMNTSIQNESCYGKSDGQITAQILDGGNIPYKTMRWYNEANALIAEPKSLRPGKYYLRFEDNKNCNYEFPFSIIGKSELKVNLELIEPIKCHGYSNGKIKSNASGGNPPYEYIWKDHTQSSTSELTNIPAGKYYIELKDADQCAVSDSIAFSEPNPITLESIKIKNTDCPNLSNGAITILALNSNGNSAFLQYKAKDKTEFSPSKTISNLAKDIYKIVVRDSLSCEKEFDAEVDVDKSFDIQLPSAVSLEIGAEHQLTPILNFGKNTQLGDITGYDWNPKNNLSCSDCLSPMLFATKSQIYTLDVSYGKSCKVSAATSIEVSKPEDIYIPNSFSPNGDDKNDIWYVYGKHILALDVKVYNRVGELIYTNQDINKGWDGTYKGTKEATNIYKYIIQATYADKSRRVYEGSLNLFR